MSVQEEIDDMLDQRVLERRSLEVRRRDIINGNIGGQFLDDEDYEDCSIQGGRETLIHDQTKRVIDDLCRLSQEAVLKKSQLLSNCNNRSRGMEDVESEATMAAERDEIMQMMLGDDDRRDVSFGDESESLEIHTASAL